MADEPPAVVAAEAAVVAVVVADPDELLELSLPQAATASSDAPAERRAEPEAQPVTAGSPPALCAYGANLSSNTHAHFPLLRQAPALAFWRATAPVTDNIVLLKTVS